MRSWRVIALSVGVMVAAGALWLRWPPSPSTALRSGAAASTTGPPARASSNANSARNPGATRSPEGLWARPEPAVAARNTRRCQIGASLGPLGGAGDVIEDLSSGEIADTLSQLKAHARAGDTVAANELDYIAHRMCPFSGANSPLNDFHAVQLRESSSLAPADRNWFLALQQDRDAFNQRLTGICQQSLDGGEIDSWVTVAAAAGDPASHYSLWMFGGTNIQRNSDAELRVAASGGYPWAQYSLGARTVGETPWIIAGGNASDYPGDLLRAAAQTIPAAEGQLARCEFTGCEYIAQDIPAAIADARSAAQQGSIDAMLAIGPQLQAGQIDPDEVRAWQLISAGLQFQGYSPSYIDVWAVKWASNTLNSPTVTPKARALADQYWQQFGARILAGLGCTG